MIVNRISLPIPRFQAARDQKKPGFDWLVKELEASRVINSLTRPVPEPPSLKPDPRPIEAVSLAAEAVAPGLGAVGRAAAELLLSRPAPPPAPLLRPREVETEAPQAVPPSPEPPASRSISRQDIDRLIQSTARRFGLKPTLVRAVALAESGLDPLAQSRAGALGLMQLMPDTARALGVDDPLDPAQNLAGGCRYLKRLLKRYDNDLSLALAAYNWGPTRLDREGPDRLPRQTKHFIRRVTAWHQEWARAETPSSAS